MKRNSAIAAAIAGLLVKPPEAPRPKHEDARRPMRPPHFGANYGPTASYTPATDHHLDDVPPANPYAWTEADDEHS